MKIHISKNQLEVLMENTWGYDPSMLPKFNQEIKKEINDAKKINVKFYQLFKLMTIENVFQRPDDYRKLVTNIQKIRDEYYRKYEKYYDILETYDEYDDGEYYRDKIQFETNVNDLDTIQNDMDNIRDMIEDVVDLFSYEKIEYLDKYYSPEIIDVNSRID